MSIRLRSVGLWLGSAALLLVLSGRGERSLEVRVASTAGAAVQDKAKPTFAAQVRQAIDRGVHFLRSQQRNGNWEHMGFGIGRYQGGMTSLALLALLEAGVKPEDDVILKGLAWLRTVKPHDTYVVGLQTMVFSKADPNTDRILIRNNVDWLRRSLRYERNRVIGWGYQEPPGGIPGSDNSNSQYAVLGLREASLAGVKVNDADAFWKQIQTYYINSQNPDGGWSYRVEGGPSTITMTSAGISSLLIAGMQLYKNNEVIDKDGKISGCGSGEPDKALERALRHLGAVFTVDGRQWRYYNLYGIERAGRLSGQRFFGDHDWYRAGAEFLLNQQSPGGGWKSEHSILDGNPVIATSFALLFLSKGKTPVLIHKMVHGLPANSRGLTGDWNNDRNDVRNLTEYCSQGIFRKDGKPVPLTWQAFDASKLDPGNPESVAEMLQAPILYFNGHLAPRFTDGEKHLLKQFVDQGGFIVAEACCGRKEFDRGFRQLVNELWPDRGLEPLLEGHDVWHTPFKVPPGAFKLEGIDFGCKTSVIYAPEDMSCHWESNKFDGAEGRTFFAFRLGANIVAYATGLEPPEDKLTPHDVFIAKPDVIKRNFLRVAQLNYGGRDWQPAPNAMRNLMNHVRKEWNIDVILETKPLTIGDPNLHNYPFLYMHGRRSFSVPVENQKLLRDHLDYGGLLLADACCGKKEFDDSFRKLMEETFGPERKLEPIKLDDPLFSDRIGKELKIVKCRTKGGTPYTDAAPQLEGIRLDPKNLKSPWIVIYSKYDLGCALDRHASPDCLGHDHPSALEIAAQAVLYALKE